MGKKASEPGQGRAGERGKSLGVRGVVCYLYSDYYLLYYGLSSADMLPCRARIKWVLGSKKTIKKTRSSGSGLMSALCAQRVLLAAASALNESLLKPGPNPGFQKGIPHPAGCGSGRYPENPQPFEKGWRKLQFRLWAGFPLLHAKSTAL